jgi:outer membrane protein assembly factor BamB
MRRILIVVGVCLIGAVLIAAATKQGVTSGTITENDSASGRVTVEMSDGKTRSFKVPAKAQLTLDDKPAAVDALQVGQKVSVFVGATGEVTRIRARTETKPAEPSPAAVASEAAAPAEQPLPPEGWPQFRGPLRDNRAGDTGLLQDWPTEGPPLVLRVENLGVGYSSVSLAPDGRIFTMGSRGEDEFVIAIDGQSGAEAWAVRIGTTRKDGMGDGPRSTPTIDGEHLYALGANGDLACLNASDGYVVWSKNILQEFDAGNIGWGISESVLIDGDHLICTPGGKKATVAALDKLTGNVIWKTMTPDNPSAAYASTIVADLKGVRQYVNYVQNAVVGIRADNGDFLWSNSASANPTANCSSPVVYEDSVFSSSGYGQGCALVKITGKRGRDGADLVYKNTEMRNHHGGIVLIGKYVYGADEGIMKCLDVTTGDVMWQDRSVGKGAVVYVDGKIILRSEQGPLALMDATPDGYQERGRFDQPDRSNQAAWAHPAVADGRLYLRDQGLLLVYDLKGK